MRIRSNLKIPARFKLRCSVSVFPDPRDKHKFKWWHKFYKRITTSIAYPRVGTPIYEKVGEILLFLDLFIGALCEETLSLNL